MALSMVLLLSIVFALQHERLCAAFALSDHDDAASDASPLNIDNLHDGDDMPSRSGVFPLATSMDSHTTHPMRTTTTSVSMSISKATARSISTTTLPFATPRTTAATTSITPTTTSTAAATTTIASTTIATTAAAVFGSEPETESQSELIGAWQLTSAPLGSSWFVAAASNSGEYLFASAGDIGVYYSHDFGNTWSPAGTIPTLYWQAISCTGDGQFVAAISDDPSNIFYVSNNYGVTWTNRSSLFSLKQNTAFTTVAVSNATGQYVVVTGFGQKLYVSNNFGMTFTGFNPVLTWFKAVVSSDGSVMAACSGSSNYNEGVYVSTDFGNTWTYSSPETQYNQFTDMTITANGGTMYVVDSRTRSGIYVSTNSGSFWTQLATAPNASFSSITASSDARYLVAYYGMYNVHYTYASSDYGQTWAPTQNQPSFTQIASSGTGQLVVGAGYNEGLYIYEWGCPAGYVKRGFISGSSYNPCVPCGSGTYAANASEGEPANTCIQCPEGTYSPGTAHSTPETCKDCAYPLTTVSDGSAKCSALYLAIGVGWQFFFYGTVLFFFAGLMGWTVYRTDAVERDTVYALFVMLVFPLLDIFTDFAYLASSKFYDVSIFALCLVCFLHPAGIFIGKLVTQRAMPTCFRYIWWLGYSTTANEGFNGVSQRLLSDYNNGDGGEEGTKTGGLSGEGVGIGSAVAGYGAESIYSGSKGVDGNSVIVANPLRSPNGSLSPTQKLHSQGEGGIQEGFNNGNLQRYPPASSPQTGNFGGSGATAVGNNQKPYFSSSSPSSATNSLDRNWKVLDGNSVGSTRTSEKSVTEEHNLAEERAHDYARAMSAEVEKGDHIPYPTVFGNTRFTVFLALQNHDNIFALCFELTMWVLAIALQAATILFFPAFLVFWLFVGCFLEITKTITLSSVWNFWFFVWTASNDFDDLGEGGVDTEELNYALLLEFFLETMPQIILQVTNNSLLGSWATNPVAILSFLMSILLALNVVYRYLYHAALHAVHTPMRDVPLEQIVRIKISLFSIDWEFHLASIQPYSKTLRNHGKISDKSTWNSSRSTSEGDYYGRKSSSSVFKFSGSRGTEKETAAAAVSAAQPDAVENGNKSPTNQGPSSQDIHGFGNSGTNRRSFGELSDISNVSGGGVGGVVGGGGYIPPPVGSRPLQPSYTPPLQPYQQYHQPQQYQSGLHDSSTEPTTPSLSAQHRESVLTAASSSQQSEQHSARAPNEEGAKGGGGSVSGMGELSGLPPHEIICPITGNIMRDPVIFEDGYTYERTAIAEFVCTHGCSPLTRLPSTSISVGDNSAVVGQRLVPNRTVLSMIQKYQLRYTS